jgi:hypothetical protein
MCCEEVHLAWWMSSFSICANPESNADAVTQCQQIQQQLWFELSKSSDPSHAPQQKWATQTPRQALWCQMQTKQIAAMQLQKSSEKMLLGSEMCLKVLFSLAQSITSMQPTGTASTQIFLGLSCKPSRCQQDMSQLKKHRVLHKPPCSPKAAEARLRWLCTCHPMTLTKYLLAYPGKIVGSEHIFNKSLLSMGETMHNFTDKQLIFGCRKNKNLCPPLFVKEAPGSTAPLLYNGIHMHTPQAVCLQFVFCQLSKVPNSCLLSLKAAHTTQIADFPM